MTRATKRIIIVAGLALALWLTWLGTHYPRLAGPRSASPVSQTTAQEPAATPTPASVGMPLYTVAAPVGPAGSTPIPAISAAATPLVSPPTLASGTEAGTNPARTIDRDTAMTELQKVHVMIASYHTLMGQNPVGTNAEIMKALMGGNPKQAMLGPPDGQTLNSKGELLDPWGTPYFFHQLSGNDMEINSAGPDRRLGTGDDLIIH